MKPYGYGVRNQRGQRLIDFTLENKIAIINTFFNKKPKHRWTWRLPNGDNKNEIDFIISNKPNMIQNIEVLNINYSSVHCPIRETITLKNFKKNRTSYSASPNSLQKTLDEVNKYRENIISHLSTLTKLQDNCSIQYYYDTTVNTISESLQKSKMSNTNTNKTNIIL